MSILCVHACVRDVFSVVIVSCSSFIVIVSWATLGCIGAGVGELGSWARTTTWTEFFAGEYLPRYGVSF